MNNFYRSNKAFRDLVELLFISEYELYKPVEKRSARARATNDGETLIGLLSVDLEACDKKGVLGILNRSVTPSEINSFIGRVRFKSFEALADDDMLPGTRASLSPQLLPFRQFARRVPVSPLEGILCRGTPPAFGFLQIHVENADQSTTIPLYISPPMISGSIHGTGLKTVSEDFGDIRSTGPNLPHSVETLLEYVSLLLILGVADDQTSHLNKAVARDKHNKFKLRARMKPQDLLRFTTSLGDELPDYDPNPINRMLKQAKEEGLTVNLTTMSP